MSSNIIFYLIAALAFYLVYRTIKNSFDPDKCACCSEKDSCKTKY
jgi:hypothetical protein